MVITGCASTLKCFSTCFAEAGIALRSRRPGTRSAPDFQLDWKCHCEICGQCDWTGESWVFIVRLRFPSSERADPPSVDRRHKDSHERFRYRVLRVRFFHTKQCSCQRWRDSCAEK